MTIHCLHTSGSDVAVYDTLFSASGAFVPISHAVRPDLLKLVQSNDPTAATAVTAAIEHRQNACVVLCTCTSLAPFVDISPTTLNITHGAMLRSVDFGSDILVVLTKTGLQSAMEGALMSYDPTKRPRVLICDTGTTIAQQVNAEIDATKLPDCILLAQASLRTAAPLIQGNIPVLTTPELAVEAALERARA